MGSININKKVITVTWGCGLLGRKYVEEIASAVGTPVIIDD